jgi:hypothetical protein
MSLFVGSPTGDVLCNIQLLIGGNSSRTGTTLDN